MQGFNAAIHHFREAGIVGNLGNRQASVSEQARSAASGEQFNTTLLQGTGELHDTGLVRNAEQGTADWASVFHLYFVLKFKFTGQIFTERSGRSIDCILFSGGIFYTKSNGGRIFIAC